MPGERHCDRRAAFPARFVEALRERKRVFRWKEAFNER
jgi:hypothetical protein